MLFQDIFLVALVAQYAVVSGGGTVFTDPALRCKNSRFLLDLFHTGFYFSGTTDFEHDMFPFRVKPTNVPAFPQNGHDQDNEGLTCRNT